jgi:hypothetical protein
MINSSIDKMLENPVINSSSATVNALEGTQNLTNRLDYVVFGLFIGLCLALIITSWFIGGIPILMVIYFLVVVFGVVFGLVLQYAYDNISTSSYFSTTLVSFPLTNNLLSNLGLYASIIGIIGLIVMFAKPYIGGGE